MFGYGIYQGDKRPSEAPRKPMGFMGEVIAKADRTNPLILLDSGEYVWGCECWWGAEGAARNRIGDREIVIVTVADEIKKAEAEHQAQVPPSHESRDPGEPDDRDHDRVPHDPKGPQP
jgi:hypothetical protein